MTGVVAPDLLPRLGQRSHRNEQHDPAHRDPISPRGGVDVLPATKGSQRGGVEDEATEGVVDAHEA
jgi:hypothetical protein